MKNKLLILLIAAGLASGCVTRTYSPQTAVSTNSFTSPSGRTFKVIHTTEKDRFEQETERREKSPPPPKPDGNGGGAGPAASADTHAENFSEADDDEFEGTDRAAAKTSIATAPMENFQKLKALLATLQKDKAMISRQPPISKAKTSNRVSEETRNVTVDAFLFAAKKEDDNDYHVILGNAPKGAWNKFLNVEISGVPAQGPFRQPLISARHDFEEFFKDNDKALPGTSGYSHYQPPIHVSVSGSLFYDIDHKPGEVGPMKIRPKTSWEIHPVTRVEFEP